MSSVHHLRHFISARLTAAAEEIFSEFEKTIVQYEEEIDRQRKLLDITWKPRGNFHTADLPQQHDRKEVVLTDQQLLKQQKSSSLDQEEPEPPQIKEDQEEPEPPQIKEDQEEVHISPGEQLVVKDDPDMEVQCKSECEERTEFQHSSIQHKEETADQPRLSNITAKPRIRLRRMGQFDHFGDLDAAEEEEGTEYKKKEMRHKEVTPEELKSLEDDKDDMNTKKTTKWAIKTLRDFLAQKNMDINFESYTAAALNDTLRLFYASVQSTKEGGKYSVASLRSLRAGINRHLPDVNIIYDSVFKSSNAVFKAILKHYRKSGKDTSVHHPRIPESDLEIIRCSPALSPDTPLGLVRKVWFDIQLCLARRGRDGNRELTMASFSIQRDQDGVEYVNLAHKPGTKRPSDPHKQNLRGFMFARPEDPLCPVKSFKKYISKCPPDAKSFYLHPKRSVTTASAVWYSKEPMGVHYLGDMLKKISEEVGLSRIYTNHSLRSTAMGRLSDAGLETRQIMSVTGHRCESSLRTPSVQERREWSNILSSRNVPSSSGDGPQTFSLRPSNAAVDMPASL